MGWIGTVRQVKHYLMTVRADRDDEGRFILMGAPEDAPVTFLGLTGDDAEIVVKDEVSYLSGGQPLNLAGGLRSTSMGLGVRVF